MRVPLTIAILMLMTALGGCVEEAQPSETSDTMEPTSTSETDDNETRTPTTSRTNATNSTNHTTPMANNTAPTANLTHDLVNDTVAINTTFNFTVNGTDADGDNLTWDLDVDGDNESDYNGTDEDFGEVEHNYTKNGTYNVTLVVSDGLLNATANVTINVTSGGGGARFEDSVLLPCPTCPDITTDAVEFELTPDLVGLPFLVESSKGDPDIMFTAEDCDGDALDHENVNGAEEGEVPEGAACLIVWEFSDVDSDITATIGTPPPEEE
jgi:PKD repeat protein